MWIESSVLANTKNKNSTQSKIFFFWMCAQKDGAEEKRQPIQAVNEQFDIWFGTM